MYYKKLLSGHELKNSPVVGTYGAVVRHIFRPSIKLLQGKTPATGGMHVIGYRSKVPILIARKYRDVVLTGERNVRTEKERVRYIYVKLPFEKMPGRLIVEMVYTCIFWLNCFTSRKQ